LFRSVAFGEALRPEFKAYQERIVKNARALAGALMERGFKLVSGGTDNHLILVDLRSKNVTGQDAERRLDEVGVTVNKNMIPFDPQPPRVTSGIRIGTPAVTTRGMKEEDMVKIAEIIAVAIDDMDSAAALAKARGMVKELCAAHPLY
ncbi:serine hydroxymethyltransferase, partial [Desulforudis sp. 1190]